MPPTDWWERLYRSSEGSQLPWYTKDLDPDLAAALEKHAREVHRVLGLGTGPATQALALAKRGYEVTATDISDTAVRRGREAARAAGLTIEFRVDNILDSRLAEGLVDTVVDRGVFHVLPPESRPEYVRTVHRILAPHGLLFLKSFSDKETSQGGPYRLSKAELREYFRRSFEVLSIQETTFQGTLRPAPRAYFATYRRR